MRTSRRLGLLGLIAGALTLVGVGRSSGQDYINDAYEALANSSLVDEKQARDLKAAQALRGWAARDNARGEEKRRNEYEERKEAEKALERKVKYSYSIIVDLNNDGAVDIKEIWAQRERPENVFYYGESLIAIISIENDSKETVNSDYILSLRLGKNEEGKTVWANVMQKRIQTPARNHSTYHDKIIVKSTGEYLAVIQNPVDKTLEVFKYRIEDEK